MVANIAQWGFIFGGGRGRRDDRDGSPIAAIAMMILAPIAAALIQMAISRSREYQADESGAQLCGNPMWLASALKKLEAGSQRIPDGCDTHDRASVHRESFAWRRNVQPLQHASSDGSPNCTPGRDGLRTPPVQLRDGKMANVQFSIFIRSDEN